MLDPMEISGWALLATPGVPPFFPWPRQLDATLLSVMALISSKDGPPPSGPVDHGV